jgi:hypothetical protein
MMSSDSSESIEVFYSYAQKDEGLRKELEKHLGSLKRLNLIRDWSNQNIPVGANRRQAVDVHLNTAHVILLLISADFIASDYCYSVEMQRALERHKQGKARVIPVLLREVYLGDTPIAALRVLPADGVPVTKWPDLDAAFTDVAKGIREVIQDIKAPFDNKYLTDKNKPRVKNDVSAQDSIANKMRETTVRPERGQNVTHMSKHADSISSRSPLRFPSPATNKQLEWLKSMRSIIILLFLFIIVLIIGDLIYLHLLH